MCFPVSSVTVGSDFSMCCNKIPFARFCQTTYQAQQLWDFKSEFLLIHPERFPSQKSSDVKEHYNPPPLLSQSNRSSKTWSSWAGTPQAALLTSQISTFTSRWVKVKEEVSSGRRIIPLLNQMTAELKHNENNLEAVPLLSLKLVIWFCCLSHFYFQFVSAKLKNSIHSLFTCFPLPVSGVWDYREPPLPQAQPHDQTHRCEFLSIFSSRTRTTKLHCFIQMWLHWTVFVFSLL